MNIDNFQLIIVSILVGKHIKDLTQSPKEVIHQLVRVCMNNKARHCAPTVYFSNKKITRYKYKDPEYYMPICSVIYHSVP